jgi:glycine/D-amino acid oxidase-like deaminating enzyme
VVPSALDIHVAVIPHSLWWDTLPATLTQPLGEPLDGDATADVAIVGAGYTGLWTAYYLQMLEPTMRIALIEAEVAGFGASGRNGGWASALFPASLEALARLSSRSEAVRMQRAMNATVSEIGRVAAEHDWDIHYAHGGTLRIARNKVQVQRMQDEVAYYHDWGFTDEDHRYLDPQDATHMFAATDNLGGAFTPHCAAIHPARLVRSLATEVVRRGARIFEHTAALEINPGNVRTHLGTVHAPIVVRATEGYTRDLVGQRRRYAPIYSLMIATEPLPAEVWAEIGLAQRTTFSDARHLIIYGQRTADGRIAFGGRGAPYHFGSRIKPSQDQHPRVHAELASTLSELLPQVRDAQITHTWGGPLGVPRDWMASCGLDRSTGLAWCGGYVGDGVGTSNLGGRTLADLITGRQSDLVSLPWVNHRNPNWEIEPLRWIGTNLGLAVMSSADKVEARTGRPARRAEVFGRFLGE